MGLWGSLGVALSGGPLVDGTCAAQDQSMMTMTSIENPASIGLQNLDFEKGSPLDFNRPEGWRTLTEMGIREADMKAVHARDTKTSHSGKYSVRIDKSTEDGMAGWMQRVSCASGGKRYVASVWIKTDEISGPPVFKSGVALLLIFFMKGLPPVVYESPFLRGAQDWRQQKLTFIVPEGCSEMALILAVQSIKGSIWWDQVSIQEIPPVSGSALKEMGKSEMDPYGGWKHIKGNATGFFHTEKIGNRWWIISPEGNGFIVTGLQYMFRDDRDSKLNEALEKIEEIRKTPTNSNNMREHFNALTRIVPYVADRFSFDVRNLLPHVKSMEIEALIDAEDRGAAKKIEEVFEKIERAINLYGPQQQWVKTTAQRSEEWGFNTLSHIPRSLFRKVVYDAPVSRSLWGFPFAIPPEIRVPLTGIDPADILYDAISFPDVFDGKFKEILEKDFRMTAARLRDDPWLLGYFLGNELPWGGNPLLKNPPQDCSVFDMFFALRKERAGKNALVEFLKAQYDSNTKVFNTAWGTSIKDFRELLTLARLGNGIQTDRCQADRSKFLRLVAESYFKINYEIVKRYDPHHMILGVRFAGHAVPQEVLETVGQYVDIVSFQPYDPIAPLEWLEDSYQYHRKPILISEFTFKAKDSGLPNTMGPGCVFGTQKERGLWYDRFVSRLLSSPIMVGQIWYKYADDPPRTRGEYSNVGLVTYQDIPYEDLVKKVREVNHKVYHLAPPGMTNP
jgi:hypothetical protein